MVPGETWGEVGTVTSIRVNLKNEGFELSLDILEGPL